MRKPKRKAVSLGAVSDIVDSNGSSPVTATGPSTHDVDSMHVEEDPDDDDHKSEDPDDEDHKSVDIAYSDGEEDVLPKSYVDALSPTALYLHENKINDYDRTKCDTNPR